MVAPTGVRDRNRCVFIPVEHADEILRFQQRVVAGPLDTDCHVWSRAVSNDGYGVNRR